MTRMYPCSLEMQGGVVAKSEKHEWTDQFPLRDPCPSVCGQHIRSRPVARLQGSIQEPVERRGATRFDAKCLFEILHRLIQALQLCKRRTAHTKRCSAVRVDGKRHVVLSNGLVILVARCKCVAQINENIDIRRIDHQGFGEFTDGLVKTAKNRENRAQA